MSFAAYKNVFFSVEPPPDSLLIPPPVDEARKGEKTE
jgi:hypothetical protein